MGSYQVEMLKAATKEISIQFIKIRHQSGIL